MVATEYVEEISRTIKQKILKCIRLKKYEDALELISTNARVLYQTNVCYMDEELEDYIKLISDKIQLSKSGSNCEYKANDDYILFYDGFGFNNRGLAYIYLKALCKVKKVIYITYCDRQSYIPDIQNLLRNHNCEWRYLKRKKKTIIQRILQLYEYVEEFRPEEIFFYSVPWDVTATPLLFAFEGLITRYQINLTDHAFWLGAKCVDKCIEFRQYGASISYEYRKIAKEKIIIIPFYPLVHREKSFKGFPFKKVRGQKVIFSGGALYKTFGDDNKYYVMINHILNNHSEVIFWYAGSGDKSEIKRLQNSYPDRVFLTEERSDLFQIMEQCDIYISTYPLCGGLMLQYAAVAGLVPVTLKKGTISDGFLINQEHLDVEFTDLKSLYDEIDRLLYDEEYLKEKSELIKESVIDSETFDSEIMKLLYGGDDLGVVPKFQHIDTDEFRKDLLNTSTKIDIDAMYARRDNIKIGVKYYPTRFIRGGLYIAKRKIAFLLNNR